MVFGVYNPYATIVPNGLITLIFWLLYVRFLYMYFTFNYYSPVSVTPSYKDSKIINIEDKNRIYDDCFTANFLWLYMNRKNKYVFLKSRARTNQAIIVRKLTSFYIVEKGRIGFSPLIMSMLPFALFVNDFISIFGS